MAVVWKALRKQLDKELNLKMLKIQWDGKKCIDISIFKLHFALVLLKVGGKAILMLSFKLKLFRQP